MNLKLSHDSNGNKIVQIKQAGARAFSIQTLGNLPKVHRMTAENIKYSDNQAIAESEIRNHVKQCGTKSQKTALGCAEIFYFVFIWGDIEPETFGPFGTYAAMLEKARGTREKEGPDEGGFYWFAFNGKDAPKLDTFTGAAFDDIEPEHWQQLNKYKCYKCNHKWADVYECSVDMECPDCGAKACSPYESETVSM